MQDFLIATYPWVKAFHVIAVITWMAGLFYLPRLFVYHVEGPDKLGVTAGSDIDRMLQKQERLLLRAIMNPAMIATWLMGGLLAEIPGIIDWGAVWPWTKAAAVLAMTGYHMFLARARRRFASDENALTGRQWRLLNELPTVLMIVIVLSVIVKF